MQPPSSDASKGSSFYPELVTVDDQGDVILAAGSKHLRVSSDVLRNASPVFRIMLQPGLFLEGQTYRDSSQPLTVELKDDAPDVLTVLCNILHFKAVCLEPDIAFLAAFTDLCDKYQCTTAVFYHVTHWLALCKQYVTHTNPERIQLLWVTYVFGLSSEFKKVSHDLIRRLNAAEVELIQIHEGLPEALRGDIRAVRLTMMDWILSVVQHCVKSLREGPPYHMFGEKRCMDCDQSTNSKCRKCPRCGSTTMLSVLCTNNTRVRKFTRWLAQECNLWPLDWHEHRSPETILQTLLAANCHSLYSGHEDVYGSPVESAKDMLKTEVARQIGDEAPKLSLRDYRVL